MRRPRRRRGICVRSLLCPWRKRVLKMEASSRLVFGFDCTKQKLEKQDESGCRGPEGSPLLFSQI